MAGKTEFTIFKFQNCTNKIVLEHFFDDMIIIKQWETFKMNYKPFVLFH